jgi:hypothetical protein
MLKFKTKMPSTTLVAAIRWRQRQKDRLLGRDYTSVPSWQACRDSHIVLTMILDLDLYLWAYCYGLLVGILSKVLRVCNSLSLM